MSLAAGFLACVSAVGANAGAAAAQAGALHVPSPDWRDQVLYFVMTDRFDDGDPRNDDQGAGEYDPADPAHWSGGDLAGLRRRLDYIQGLGATAVWVTPPVANLWWDSAVNYGGYHGYWASDFTKVDAHLGTLADYRGLARDLHARGMYLVQDIVLNHTGNFFGYDGGWDAADPARYWRRFEQPGGQRAPTQFPFSQDDPRDPAQRTAGIYHWTPDIRDYADPVQEKTWQMAGLDDLATENPVVRRALRASYARWIREAGVDGFRVDTAFYVEPELFADFLYADDPQAPGIDRVARATGREAFHVFGEGFAIDKPLAEDKARRIDTLMRAPDGTPRLHGMLNFPLYGTLGDVFARGRPTADLAYRIDSVMRVHAQPHLMPTFVDNHDVDRFLAGGGVPGLEQALLALMTLPGIPTIYYGTEQGFTGQRAAMFAKGVGSGGRDHFDTSAPLYRYLQQVIALRRTHKVLSRGVPTVLRANAAGPGVIAWRMDYDGQAAFVAMNTGEAPMLLDAMETGLAAGARLAPVFAVRAEAGAAVGLDDAGRLTTTLPPRAAVVWMGEVGGLNGPKPASEGSVASGLSALPRPAAPTLAPLAGEVVPDDFDVTGTAAPDATLRLVVDGNLATASVVRADAQGRWQARVDTSGFADPAIAHRLVAFVPATGTVSQARTFRVDRPWRLLAEAADPVGDDHGPAGTYRYPADPSWAPRQMDIEALRVFGAGTALAVEVQLHAITTPWNPPNGFDHVALTLFIDVPGHGPGATVMPLQDATLPAGMRWQYRLRAHGWSNALYSAAGADATHEGTPVTPGATIQVDVARRTVRFILPGAALGLVDAHGVRVLATTWDYDGGFRPLSPEGGTSIFGGGAAGDPRVMDASAVVAVP